MCVGLGAAACMRLIKMDITFTPSIDITVGGTSSTKDSNSASIGFSWSYETSGNPWTHFYTLPGEVGVVTQQTMYLTPSLNIVYSLSLHVTFDDNLCAAMGQQVTTWFVHLLLIFNLYLMRV